MSIVDDIVEFLVAQSTAFTLHAGTSGGNIMKATMLDDSRAPATLVSVYETAGLANAYTFSTSTGAADVAYERPGFQILSRSTRFTTARTNAQTAYEILDGLAQRNLPTATGTLYLDIEAVQAPFFSGNDENHRPVISTNYLVRKVR